MIYPYITLADGTEIVYTNVFEEDGLQKVEVHFERPTENGFDTARCQLPSYKWIIRDGFTDEEMKFLISSCIAMLICSTSMVLTEG